MYFPVGVLQKQLTISIIKTRTGQGSVVEIETALLCHGLGYLRYSLTGAFHLQLDTTESMSLCDRWHLLPSTMLQRHFP